MEIRILKLQIIAATSPPFSTKASPKNQAKLAAIEATKTCLTQAFLLTKICISFDCFNFIYLILLLELKFKVNFGIN
ncbi:MAG: hypothetical protein ACKPKO_39450, partial [Candidatus Fonsibacter sp.]